LFLSQFEKDYAQVRDRATHLQNELHGNVPKNYHSLLGFLFIDKSLSYL
jgi:hypothetical protein